MKYSVVFSPEAEEQLAELYGYIATAASPEIAARYTEAIANYCESLCTLGLSTAPAWHWFFVYLVT